MYGLGFYTLYSRAAYDGARTVICNFLKNLFYSVLSIFTQVLFSNDNRFNDTSSIYADPSF